MLYFKLDRNGLIYEMWNHQDTCRIQGVNIVVLQIMISAIGLVYHRLKRNANIGINVSIYMNQTNTVQQQRAIQFIGQEEKAVQNLSQAVQCGGLQVDSLILVDI